MGRIFYYDQSNKQGYAGCCDLIYMDNNAEIILADFKTSAGPYSTKFPNKKTEVDEIPEVVVKTEVDPETAPEAVVGQGNEMEET